MMHEAEQKVDVLERLALFHMWHFDVNAGRAASRISPVRARTRGSSRPSNDISLYVIAGFRPPGPSSAP